MNRANIVLTSCINTAVQYEATGRCYQEVTTVLVLRACGLAGDLGMASLEEVRDAVG